MEILDKKSNRMSRANSGVFEHSEYFLSLRNLLSNELFFTFYLFTTAHFFLLKINYLVLKFYSSVFFLFFNWAITIGDNNEKRVKNNRTFETVLWNSIE